MTVASATTNLGHTKASTVIPTPDNKYQKVDSVVAKMPFNDAVKKPNTAFNIVITSPPVNTVTATTITAAHGAAILSVKIKPPTPAQEPLTTKGLIDRFSECWDKKKCAFLNLPERAFQIDQLNTLLHAYVEKFGNKIDHEKNYGFIEKRELPPSKIFVRADLHGDLKSLIENLLQLQKLGYLDANFKCKSNFQLIFLGDYVDRGNHNLENIALLACLKMANPDQVHLIRGNHEYTVCNMVYNSDPIFKKYLVSSRSLLEKFYETMPLSIYVCEVNEKQAKEKEYLQFTHGTFELAADPSEILDSEATFGRMVISKRRILSERVTNLCIYVPPTLIDSKKVESNFQTTILELESIIFVLQTAKVASSVDLSPINAQYKNILTQQVESFDKEASNTQKQVETLTAELEKIRSEEKEIQLLKLQREVKRMQHLKAKLEGLQKNPLTPNDIPQLKLEVSAMRIRQLVEMHRLKDNSLSFTTYYNWSDVEKQTAWSARGIVMWNLSPQDIGHYFDLSSIKHKVKFLLRGHQHEYAVHKINKKVIGITLTIGVDSEKQYVSQYSDVDIAYVLTTAPKIEDWKKVILKRSRGEDSEKESEEYAITDENI